MWHSLSAAALSCCSNSRCHLGPPAASKSVAAAMVKLLQAAGADPAASIAAAPWATGWGAHSWLLHLGSRCRQLAMLELLLERSRQGGLPLRFDRASMLVLLSCQADCPNAYRHFAAALPAGRLPAEYRQLAAEAVGIACSATSDGSSSEHRQVLRCMVQAGAAAAPGPLAAHVADQLATSLAAAALEGQISELQLLLTAGVPVSAAAVRSAIRGGCPEALALLLRCGAPPADPLPADAVLRVPSRVDGGNGSQYPPPLQTLLVMHALEVRLSLSLGVSQSAGMGMKQGST
jgi:hypothetical protein